MAKYAASNIVIEVDNSGGSLVDMSQHVQEINGIDIEAVTEESHTFGDSWVEHLFASLKRTADIVLTGMYDDAATTGPNVIFNSLGDTRTFKITYGSTKTTSVEAIITKYTRMPSRGALTKYSVTLRPTGAVTEA